jgi:CubicO group peptidase (beta-lactamase class C family)
MVTKRINPCLYVLLLSGLCRPAQAAPWIDPADDARHFGKIDNVLFWQPDQQVAGYRNMDRLTAVRWIHASEQPLVLPERSVDLDNVQIPWDGGRMPLADYLEKQSVAGLLVVKDGTIVYERYRLGNDRDSRWISYSVAKSVVSMLVGAAIRDGYIGSVDEKVTDYLPRLKGSAYEQASIADLLQMSSGVAWNETYDDPESDVNQVSWATLDLMNYLKEKRRQAAPGAIFNYSTAETNLVGALLRAAIGNNLSTYLEQKIWQPFGMEADADWNLTEPGGAEFGGCCINATLRDYARLGLFALNNGRLADGTAVLPEDWMARSTTPASSNPRYGYLWWLDGSGAYQASGIFGQGIYIQPEQNLVIALHSARPDASREQDWQLQAHMYQAIQGALSEPAAP